MSALGSGGAMAAAGVGRPLDFRRRGAPPRRRRRSPLLALAKPLGIAALAVALPLALGAWLLTSRQFQLHGIDVAPARAPGQAAARVPSPWVRQALAPLLGRNLLRLRLAEVRLRLAANPWIAAAEVAKELPDRLQVTVAERRPAVLLRGAFAGRAGGAGGAGAESDALVYADAAGRPIAAVGSPAAAAAARRRGLLVVGLPRYAAAGATGKLPALRPELLAPPGSDVMPAAAAAGIAGALQLAAQLRRLRPAWTTALTQIDVVDEDDYQLRVEGLPCPLLVRGSRLADNLVRFEQLLPELRRRYPALAAVDLRFSRRIVVQLAPAAPQLPVKAALPVKPEQVVKPAPPAPAAAKTAPPPPAASSSRASDTL
jgi:cell division septal protein FtsQ